MNSKKVFYGMLGAIGLLTCLVIASVFLSDMLLKKQSNKLVSLKLDNEIIENQQTAVAQAKRDLQKYSELGTIAKQIVPQDKDQARAVREIVTIADQAGVKVNSVTFPASNLGTTIPKPAASGDSSGSASTTTTTPTTTTAPVTQVKPVDGVKGLYQLDINVVTDSTKPISYSKLLDFLSRLEKNRRTAQVTQISIVPDSTHTGLNLTLTVTVYIKP